MSAGNPTHRFLNHWVLFILLFAIPNTIAQQDSDSVDVSAAQAAIQKLNRAKKPDKRYGEVCSNLTGDNECKVCIQSNGDAWTCSSRTMWQEASRTASCDPNWSSKLDQISDPQVRGMFSLDSINVRANGKQFIDEYVRRLGSVDKFMQAAEQSQVDDQDQLTQHQKAGDSDGVAKLEQMMLFNAAMMEIGRCRMSGEATPSSRPLNSENCKKLVEYRDTQLVKDFDIAMSRYNIFKKGSLNLGEIRQEGTQLMDKEWLGGKTGAEIAIEVRYYADLFKDSAEVLVPEATFVKLFGEVAKSRVDLVSNVGVTIDLIKKEEYSGAKQAALDAWIEVAKMLSGQAGSLIGTAQDMQTHSEHRKELEDAKERVREQVENIDRTLDRYSAKMQESRARSENIARIVAQIDRSCNASTPPSLSVNPPR
jgi:hypothetical protein